MMLRVLYLVVPLLSLAAGPCLAAMAEATPVTIQSIKDGGQAIAPGTTVAQVTGLRKGGDGFLSVRSAPDKTAPEIARLKPKELLIIALPPGDWEKAEYVGAILNRSGKGTDNMMADCKLSEAPPYFEGVYQGPCQTGWVARRFVTVLAD